MKLYEIKGALRAALDRMEVDEETGEILNADALEVVEAEAHEKIEGAALYVREIGHDIDALKDEIDRLSKRKRALEKRTVFIKDLMLEGLDALKAQGLKTPCITVSVRTSKAVELDADALDVLPEGFIRIKREADKAAIKAAIEGGFEVPGAHLVENRSVTMR